jgi:hypothetical protein
MACELTKAADRIVNAIQGAFNKKQNLAVYNERDINLMLSYKVANGQIDIIKQGYTKLFTPTLPFPACPTPSPSSSPT